MGNQICCCVKGEGYEPIDDSDNAPASVNPTPSKENNIASSVVEKKEDVVFQFAENSPVFQGTKVFQKFSNKGKYDKKFAWVDLRQRTLNLSEHETKERRHKEASLSDVMGVVAGPPEKYNRFPGEEDLDESKCMSVKFKRGGGIDMKFETNEQRDNWYNVILHLVLKQETPNSSAQPQTN